MRVGVMRPAAMRDPFPSLLRRLEARLRSRACLLLPPHIDLAVWTAAPMQTWTTVPEYRRALDRLGAQLGVSLSLPRAQAQPVCFGRLTYVAVRVAIAPRRITPKKAGEGIAPWRNPTGPGSGPACATPVSRTTNTP